MVDCGLVGFSCVMLLVIGVRWCGIFWLVFVYLVVFVDCVDLVCLVLDGLFDLWYVV